MRPLDRLYLAAGYLAAFFMVATLAMVLAGVAGRLLRFHLRGSDAYAGYCMAAAGFLALAHTFRRGEHIRVTLVIERFGRAARKWSEALALAVATLFGGIFAWFSARLVWQSYTLNDISQGNDASPLWIPQLGMAVGTLVLFVALVDALQLHLRGKPYVAAGPGTANIE
jgi:TRAP-type C4-dicarboxylate transport system permease small subunit